VGDVIRIDGAARGIGAGRAERERIETVGRQFMGEIARMLEGAGAT
jgi:hypothetical protein